MSKYRVGPRNFWGEQIKDRILHVPLEYLIGITILFFGFIFTVIAPPFWGLDEVAHFNRALEISTGQFTVTKNVKGDSGRDIPANLAEIQYTTYADLIDNKNTAISMRSDRTKTINYDGLLEQQFSSKTQTTPITATYSPIAYAGAVPGMAVARLVDATIGQTLFMGRISGLAFYAMCVFVSLWLTRKSKIKWLIATVALMPVSIFQASVITADTVSNSLSILLFTSTYLLITQKNTDRRKKYIIAGIAAATLVLLPLVKVTNITFLLLLPIIPVAFIKSKLLQRSLKWGVAIISLGLAYVWTKLSPITNVNSTTPRLDGLPIDPAGQIAYIMHYPAQFAIAMFRTMYDVSDAYIRSLTVEMGWNMAPMPVVFSFVVLACVIITAIYARSEFVMHRRALMVQFVVGLIGVMAIFAALYVGFNPVGHKSVDGVQGRYFFGMLPFMILIPIALVRVRLSRSVNLWPIILTMMAVDAFSIVNYLLVLY